MPIYTPALSSAVEDTLPTWPVWIMLIVPVYYATLRFFSNLPIMLPDFPIMLRDFTYYAQI